MEADVVITDVTSGGGANLQPNKNFTPSETTTAITPDSGYDGLQKVTVAGITSTYVGTGVARKSSETFTPTTTN
jgi:hypothetical protein